MYIYKTGNTKKKKIVQTSERKIEEERERKTMKEV